MAQLFSVKYGDRHAAAMIYHQLTKTSSEVGVIAHGLEIIKTDSKKLRKNLKILMVLEKDKAGNLPAVLRVLQHSLEEHPLYEHLNFDYTAFPLSQTQWNFASYDDENYQKNFIRKRAKG